MKDSYEIFFAEFNISKETLFNFGLKETIYSPIDKAVLAWKELKENIYSNNEVYIRGFGREAKGTPIYIEFYKYLLNNSKVKKDHTNNAMPTKLISNLTGYSKQGNSCKQIINYQVSHIFGRTKNLFAFTAPWNLAYVPKVIDPFTGHEAKGELVQEFSYLFKKQAFERFGNLIEDFNSIITDSEFIKKIDCSIEMIKRSNTFSVDEITKFSKAVKKEFLPIKI